MFSEDAINYCPPRETCDKCPFTGTPFRALDSLSMSGLCRRNIRCAPLTLGFYMLRRTIDAVAGGSTNYLKAS